MLMDHHGSHVTPEFIKLANENRIRPYPLIPHLTHCMQPLAVGMFQPYKHWHAVAIRDAIAEFNVEYTITRFCQDLTKIRDNTFKKSTIQSAFEKSGIVMGYETSKLIRSDTDLERGNAQRERWKIAIRAPHFRSVDSLSASQPYSQNLQISTHHL